MGGQSFKCPLCGEWLLSKNRLRDHLKDSHNLYKVEFIESGPYPTISSSEAFKKAGAL